MTTTQCARLDWQDIEIAGFATPRGEAALVLGFGSGLAARADDRSGTLWAVGDRGPNFKVSVAVERHGLDHLSALDDRDGVKIMPSIDSGPAIAELRLDGGAITLERHIPLTGDDGRPISGLPLPPGPDGEHECAYGLDGVEIACDPSGADTEGLVALADGSFWVGDEYGPSLLHVAADGRVLVRWVPEGTGERYEGAAYPVVEALPAIAAKRRLNRGFEALAVSADERRLYLAFQSPLSHPDRKAFEQGCGIRLWTLDAETGAVIAEHLYPLDPPDSFARDNAREKVKRKDIKVSELVAIGPDRFLVLERVSHSTKIYAVTLDAARAVPPAYLDVATRPTLEQGPDGITPLDKTLIVSTDDFPDVDADLEGLILLSPTEILLVNDNDFGVEGAATAFWRITLAEACADGTVGAADASLSR